MALIKSSLLSDIRGSIGGTTYSRNRGGSYARNRTVPINPNSPNQERARGDLSYWSTEWSTTLTNNQRVAWNQYAETVVAVNVLGESITYTGQQMYIRANTLLTLAGLSPVTAAPSSNVQPALAMPAQVVAYDVSDDEVTVTLTGNHTGEFLAFCGPPQSAGSISVKVPYRAFGVVTLAATNTAVVPGSIPDRRAFSAGQNMSWRFLLVDTAGRVSNEVFMRGLAQA